MSFLQMSLPERAASCIVTECVQFKDEEFEGDMVFDFGGYFFSHKHNPTLGLHIMVCTINFMPVKTIPCGDMPGQYINGCYFTGTGKFMLDCTEAVLYANRGEVTDIPAFFAKVNDTQLSPFMKCVRREVFEQFGCDYDAWLGRMYRHYHVERTLMRDYALETMCKD